MHILCAYTYQKLAQQGQKNSKSVLSALLTFRISGQLFPTWKRLRLQRRHTYSLLVNKFVLGWSNKKYVFQAIFKIYVLGSTYKLQLCYDDLLLSMAALTSINFHQETEFFWQVSQSISPADSQNSRPMLRLWSEWVEPIVTTVISPCCFSWAREGSRRLWISAREGRIRERSRHR